MAIPANLQGRLRLPIIGSAINLDLNNLHIVDNLRQWMESQIQ